MPPRKKTTPTNQTAAAAVEDAETTAAIQLQPLRRAIIVVPIVGVTPVIPHKWAQKSIAMMQVKQSGARVQAVRDPKVPQEEAEASLYRLPDGRPGMPATAFKGAIATAARLFSGVTITALKQLVFVIGTGPDQLVPIEGEMEMRQDTPRNATGVADLRYRYAFFPWSADLEVEYIQGQIDPASIVTLVDAAGNGGVGDWRPTSPRSTTGTFGRFKVDLDRLALVPDQSVDVRQFTQ